MSSQRWLCAAIAARRSRDRRAASASSVASENTTPKPNVSSRRLRSKTATSWRGSAFLSRSAKKSPAGPPPIDDDLHGAASLLQELARDHEVLDLGRALVDPERAHRRDRAGRPDATRGRPAPPRIWTASSTIRCAASVANDFAIAASSVTRSAPVVRGPRRAVDEEPRGVELGRHARELLLHELELGERLAELPALPRVRERLVERARRHAARRRADRGAQPVERREAEREPAPSSPRRCVGGHAAVLERDLAERMRRRQDLRAARSASPGVVGGNDEARDALAARGRVGRRRTRCRSRRCRRSR